MTTRVRRIGTRLVLVLGGIVLALGLAETVCRIDALFPGRKYTPASAKAWFEARVEAGAKELAAYAAPDPKGDAATSNLRAFPHPFEGWSDARSFAQTEEESRWFADPASDVAFDVVVLGGSVAAAFANHQAARIVDALQADPRLAGRPVRVWNEAHASYKSPQPLHVLEWMLALGHRPDAVVTIDGFNEVAIACSNVRNEVHPLYPFAEHWAVLTAGKDIDVAALDLLLGMRVAQSREQSIARTALARGYCHSALITRITLSRLADQRRAFEAARNQYLGYLRQHSDRLAVRGPEFTGDDQAAIELAVRSWSESARAVHAVCVRRGLVEVHVLQPALEDAGAKALTEEELHNEGGEAAWTNGVKLGYPALRKAGAELALEGAPFDDGTRLFEHESASVYVDMCHLNDHGYALMGDLVVAKLLERLR